MYIIKNELAHIIKGKNYKENSIYNPVEIDDVFLISEIEANYLYDGFESISSQEISSSITKITNVNPPIS